jgi:hypothetical protein
MLSDFDNCDTKIEILIVWQVYDHVLQNGKLVHFDGLDHSVLNINGKVLFTHEFLLDFLHTSGHGKMTISGYWNAKCALWLQILRAHDSDLTPHEQAFLELIKKTNMSHVFLDSVFDYIGLLDVDYKKAYSCRCKDLYHLNEAEFAKRLYVIYDNACNLMKSMLLRMPTLARQFECLVDAFHHAGHSNCSPFWNSKMNAAVQNINASLNEQKNKLLRYMETSVSFMGQIRAMVYLRCCACHLDLLFQ